MIGAIIGVLVLLTFLVVIHELGHFIAARRSGIAVKEFGVGFPPRIYGLRRKKTLYSVNLLPLGGFVSIKGEDGKEKGKDSFADKSAWIKTKVLLAGVSVNFLFAYLVLCILLIFGVANIFPFDLPNKGILSPRNLTQSKVKIVGFGENSVARQAGLLAGDTIVSLNQKAITSDNRLRELTRENANQSVDIVYERDNQTKSLTVQLGGDENKGYLGAATVSEQRISYHWWNAPIVAFVVTIQLIGATLIAFTSFVSGLFLSGQVSENVTGPIGITTALPQVKRFGFDYLLLLMAQISLSLAVVNSLPIPPLDGGKALFVWLRRGGLKISRRFETTVSVAGFGLLLILIVVISVSDIVRL